MADISIVIPVYNGEKYLEKTLLSAINQTIKPKEIIIYDDGSIDSTKEICEKYNDCIKYFFNDKGPSGFVNSWNQSINFATSDYITILHQDDLLNNKFIEIFQKVISQNQDIKHFFSICNYIDENDNIINSKLDKDNNCSKIFSPKEYIEYYQKPYNGFPHPHRCPGVINHKSIFDKLKYDEKAGHIADDDFFYKVGQYTAIYGYLEPISSYRIHQDSETGTLSDIKLVKRLAKDYTYQLEQWYKNDYFPKKNYKYFEYWMKYYVLKIIKYSIIKKDRELYKEFKIFYSQNKNRFNIIDHFKILFYKIIYTIYLIK